MKTFGDKTPAECGERDCWYGRQPNPMKEENYKGVFDLAEYEIAEYNAAYVAADEAGFFAASID